MKTAFSPLTMLIAVYDFRRVKIPKGHRDQIHDLKRNTVPKPSCVCGELLQEMHVLAAVLP